MVALAKDMKLRFDSGLQQRCVEIDALIRGGHLIITSVHDENRTDTARGRLGYRAAPDDLAVVITKPWIKQTSEVRHSAGFRDRVFWLGVERRNQS